MSEQRGRPSIYRPLLDDIRTAGVPGAWSPVRYGHKNRTVVSQLRTRYPEFDFRAVADSEGGWNIHATWRGNGST